MTSARRRPAQPRSPAHGSGVSAARATLAAGCALVLSVAVPAAFTVPASAEQRQITVTLVTGETVTIWVDVPPGTPLSEIEVPGVIDNTPVAPTPTVPEQTPTTPEQAPQTDADTGRRKTTDKRKSRRKPRRDTALDTQPLDEGVDAPRRPKRTPLRNPDGSPTRTNPGFFDALPGPSAATGVPNFVIRKFRVPIFLLPIYQAAGIQYGIRWEILAAINEIETDYGRNLNVSSAGALGWMQFIPSSWRAYGVDANKDGVKDPYNPVDAIFAAARYLNAAGYEQDVRRAIFAYNHADWYVDSVMLRARLIAGVPSRPRRLAHRPDRGPLPRRGPRAVRGRPGRGRGAAAGQARPERRQRDRVGRQPARDRDLLEAGRAGRGRERRRRQEGRPLGGPRPLPGAPGRVRQPLHLRAPRQGVRGLPRPDRRRRPTRNCQRRRCPRTAPPQLRPARLPPGASSRPVPPSAGPPLGALGRRCRSRSACSPIPACRPRARPAASSSSSTPRPGARAASRCSSNYFSRPFGLDAKDVRLRTLKAGRARDRRHDPRPRRPDGRGQGAHTSTSRSVPPAGAPRGSTRSRSSTAGSCSRRPRSTAPRAPTCSTARTAPTPSRSARSCCCRSRCSSAACSE